jgi:cytochrome c oxidase cbb3-type subunit III
VRRLIPALALAAGLLAAPARAADAPAAAPAPPPAPAADTFQFLCAQCHGVHGDGTGPNASPSLEAQPANLTDPVYMAKFTDAQIARTLTLGGPANDLSSLMPPWGNRLSREEILGLVRYIRTLCGCRGPADAPAPAPGP